MLEKTNKPRVLLNWDTTRKDLWGPFLEMRDDIEFIVIWGEREDNPFHPFRQVSFADYSTPYQLLRDIQPDKILFFNLNAFTQIALNLAARNKGIPTYVMHHAIYHSDLIERNVAKEKEGLEHKAQSGVNIKTAWFYISALRGKNLGQVRKYLWFMWLRRNRERLLAQEQCVFEGRKPSVYINLSPHNALLIKRVDHLANFDQFIFIGHPFFDAILKELNQCRLTNSQEAPYYLLIDFPNVDSIVIFRKMTAERKTEFYKRLSAVARKNGCRLKVKLHPVGYDSPYNFEDENIDLIRDADMASLIHHSQKVFSFFSSLIIPAIFHKGYCYIIYTGDDRKFQDELVDLGVAVKLNAYDFTNEDVENGLMVQQKDASYEEFIQRYLYYTDGLSGQRLKKILVAKNT